MDYVIVSTSKCAYQAWQLRLLYWSMKKVQQKGKLILLMSEDVKYNPDKDHFNFGPDVEIVELPDWAQKWKDEHQDWWGGIPNKYESFNWVAAHYPFRDEDTLLFLDPDMIFVKPVEYSPKDNEIIGQRWRHYGSLPGWERFASYRKAFMYPFVLRYSTLKKISSDFKEFCFQIRKQIKKWESDMWALDYAAKNNGVEVQYIEDFGFCTVWLKNGNMDQSPVIHFPNAIEDAGKERLFFKQDYTFQQDQKIEIHRGRNRTDRTLLNNIDQERTDFIYHLKWDFSSVFKWYNGHAGYFYLKPYPGGFNNIRMSLELGICLAYLTNRTLVLPRAYRMYLLEGKSDFSNFFDLRQPGIKLLSMPEFCALKDLEQSEEAIRKISTVLDFATSEIVLNFEKVPVPQKFRRKREVLNSEDLFGEEEVIYLDKNLLGSFEQLIYTSYASELKKLVAKHVVYRNDIFDLAWQFINYIGDRTYYAMHVRRNDFQYKHLFISTSEILRHLTGIIPPGSTLYIATDHPDKSFFGPLGESYEVIFYDDIADKLELEEFDVNWIPIVEQFLCTRALRFVGMPLSTLSSYIFRMRGYMDDIEDKGFYLNGKAYDPKQQCDFQEDTQFPGSSWVREYKSIWQFIPEKIFVSIASYADTQLIPTIEDLLTQASNPSRVTIGVHIQDTEESYQKLLDRQFPNLKVIFTPKSESRGVVWARNRIKNELLADETYFLQIDAHSRFKKNWDNILINQYESIEEEKVILTTYPNSFSIADEQQEYLKVDRYSPLRIRKFLTDRPKDNRLKPENRPTLKDYEVVETKWCAAGFLFTKAGWTRDVQIPDQVKFNGEEDLMTFLSFLKGYKLRLASEATVWHCYNDKNDKTGEQYKEFNENEIRDESVEIINQLLLSEFYLKSVQDLEAFLQVKFRNPDKRYPKLPDAIHHAKGWRLLAKKTSSDFAWDVKRVRFLFQSGEQVGEVLSSGYVAQGDHDGYRDSNAFSDKQRSWGGRADQHGHFWLGMTLESEDVLERIILNQKEDHWAKAVFVQVKTAEGNWVTVRETDDLGPGLNEIVLFAADTIAVEVLPEPVRRRIRFVSAQPDEPFFVWQTRVYLQNFRELGVSMRDCVALFGTKPRGYASSELRALCVDFPVADIRLYYDRRNDEGKAYSPSIQPHLIARALQDSPEWEREVVFYHDCDIVLRRVPDFQLMLQDHPNGSFLSNTDDYIGYDYLHKCCEKIRVEKPEVPEDELIVKMCGVVGVDFEVVRERRGGGGQYLLQNAGPKYWKKVYKDSLALRKLFNEYLGGLQLREEPGHYLQVWTAGMWAYLWNLWLLEQKTVIHPELDFLFAAQAANGKATILHMAGLQKEVKHYHFDKLDWIDVDPLAAVRQQSYLFDHYPDGSPAKEYAGWIHRAAGVDPPGLQTPIPSRFWRLLVWKTDGEEHCWQIRQLWFRFSAGVTISKVFDSGSKGRSFTTAGEMADDGIIWTGVPDTGESMLAAGIFIGVELDVPAVPQEIEICQGMPNTAQVTLLQYRGGNGEWVSTISARLKSAPDRQHVLYRSEQVHLASEWRVIARETATGFAWDILRLQLLNDSSEEIGQPISSGHALPDFPEEYGPGHAFNETVRFWGGRADEDGAHWLGVRFGGKTAINRILLHQGETHFAQSIEIQTRNELGDWVVVQQFDHLTPGLNNLLLFESILQPEMTA